MSIISIQLLWVLIFSVGLSFLFELLSLLVTVHLKWSLRRLMLIDLYYTYLVYAVILWAVICSLFVSLLNFILVLFRLNNLDWRFDLLINYPFELSCATCCPLDIFLLYFWVFPHLLLVSITFQLEVLFCCFVAGIVVAAAKVSKYVTFEHCVLSFFTVW